MSEPTALEPITELAVGELDTQREHFEALDSKAGIVLGLAGAIVALTARVVLADPVDTITLVLFAAAAATGALAGLAALAAFWPRQLEVIDVQAARDMALAQMSDAQTREVILDTRLQMLEDNRDLLDDKSRLLKAALGLLVTTVVLLAAGILITAIGGPT